MEVDWKEWLDDFKGVASSFLYHASLFLALVAFAMLIIVGLMLGWNLMGGLLK